MSYQNNALVDLALQAETLPEPYLITGPQAAYIYHRWLSPITKIIHIRILKEDVPTWQHLLTSGWTVFTETPTLTQVHRKTRVAVLEPYLTKDLWVRRVIHQGLAFISPEDLSLHFLRTATTQTRLLEMAALLIKQKDTLDWAYLFNQVIEYSLNERLISIIQTINGEAGRSLFWLEMPQIQVSQTNNYLQLDPTLLIPILRPLRAQWRLANA
jgi:hypothetical protein